MGLPLIVTAITAALGFGDHFLAGGRGREAVGGAISSEFQEVISDFTTGGAGQKLLNDITSMDWQSIVKNEAAMAAVATLGTFLVKNQLLGQGAISSGFSSLLTGALGYVASKYAAPAIFGDAAVEEGTAPTPTVTYGATFEPGH